MDGAVAAAYHIFPPATVEITDDRLEARATLFVPTPGLHRPVARQHLLDSMAQAGIVYGIDNAAIDQFADALAHGLLPPEPLVVARGLPPASAQLGAPQLLVAAVAGPDTVEKVRQRAPSHYQDLVETVGTPAPARVVPGQAVIRFGPPAEDARSGIGVDGEPLEPVPPVPPLSLGPGVMYDPDQLVVASTRTGVVLYDGLSVDVLPIAFDAQIEVCITPDGLSCSVSLVSGGPGGAPLTAAAVRTVLTTAAGVRMGIIPGAVETAVAEACRAGRAVHLVAQGRGPEDGVDARLEYLVDLGPTGLSPTGDDGGRVDFKDISVIRSVAAGQPLVRRHPGSSGSSGFTVTGRLLPAHNGREARLPGGRNVIADPDDPELLLAKVAGNVRAVGGELEVSECFVVSGDVNYSTGHINYERSVVVKGDVKSGFNIEVGGDLEVAGLVEDSAVKVGGNVLIRRGFVGQGKGLVEAGGVMMLGFGRNQAVNSAGKLTVEREAINMTLTSGEEVVIAGLLVGGRVAARNRITARVLGNAGGTKTELEVGVGAQDPATVAAAGRVVVQDVVWPGVQVKIGNSPVFKVTERLPGPLTFALRDGEVRWS